MASIRSIVVLKAADSPREYERDLTDLSNITYEFDGETSTADDWLGMIQNAQAPFQEPRILEHGSYRDGYGFQGREQ